MGFCSSTFKFFTFLFNFIFFLVGVAIIGLGSYMAISMKDYFDFLGLSEIDGMKNIGLSSYIFIFVGVLVTIIAFLGCCAACTENKCMMWSFATLMLLILIAEIGVCVTMLLYKGQVVDVATDAMTRSLDEYNKEGKEGVKKTWDEIQEKFTCCGVANGPDDWKNKLGDANSAPDSCCKIEKPDCGKDAIGSTDLHQKGCLKEFESFIEGNIFLVGGVGLALIIVQLIAVITGCCLAKKFGNDGMNV
jgi:CD63 antigen